MIVPPQTKDFAMSELLSHLYSAANQEDLMEESADEVNKREELLKMYHSTKEALKIISKSNVINALSAIIIDKRCLKIPLNKPSKLSASQMLLMNGI